MNNVQLDMVLGYLNEGTEIDTVDFLYESLNELIEESMYENYMIGEILEADNGENVQKVEIVKQSKIKPMIDKFINWIKKVILNIKGVINQLTTKFSAAIVKKQIDTAIKNIKESSDDHVFVGKQTVYLLRDIANFDLEGRMKDLNTALNFNGSIKDIAKDVDKAKEFAGPMKEFSFEKAMGVLKKELSDNNEEEKVSANEIIKLLENTKSKISDAYVNSIKKFVESYNKIYKEVASIEDADPQAVNIIISGITHLCTESIKTSKFTLKIMSVILRVSNKDMKKELKTRSITKAAKNALGPNIDMDEIKKSRNK